MRSRAHPPMMISRRGKALPWLGASLKPQPSLFEARVAIVHNDNVVRQLDAQQLTG